MIHYLHFRLALYWYDRLIDRTIELISSLSGVYILICRVHVIALWLGSEISNYDFK